jgi:ribosomal protein S18 acetylase RimI-like enzyme
MSGTRDEPRSRMIERLQAQDVRAASEVLARSFLDNPGMLAVLRGDPAEHRLRVLKRAMLGFTEGVRRYGVAEVVKDEGRVKGVALAFAPGEYPPPLRAELFLSAGPISAGPRRMLRFAQLGHQLNVRHASEPHWYLWILGVEPEYQGRGVGSQLLRSLTARTQRDRVPCHLETDRASNVRIYARHGYVVTKEEVLPALDTTFWFMRRAHAQDEGGCSER